MEKIISDIALASNEASVHDLLDSYHTENLKESSIELCHFKYQSLIEKILRERDYLDTIKDANWAMLDYGEVNVEQAKKNFDYAKFFLTNPPMPIGRKPIVLSEMPDFLTDDDLHNYFGWELSTIASKRSRGELPQVNGFRLTPKNELLNLLNAKTTGSTTVKDIDEQSKAVQQKISSFKR